MLLKDEVAFRTPKKKVEGFVYDQCQIDPGGIGALVIKIIEEKNLTSISALTFTGFWGKQNAHHKSDLF